MKQAFLLSMIMFIAISSIALAQENEPEVIQGKKTGVAVVQKNKPETKPAKGIDLFKWAGLFRDIFVMALGVKGYSVWKKQLRGKENYELARRILKLVSQARRSIKLARTSEILGSRNYENIEELSSQSHEDFRRDVESSYRKRIEEHLPQLLSDELEIEGYEAEAVLGAEAKEKINSLEQCIEDLRLDAHKFYIYLNSPEMVQYGHVNEERTEAIGKLLETINRTEANDAFATRVDKVVEKIKLYLKPYLMLTKK